MNFISSENPIDMDAVVDNIIKCSNLEYLYIYLEYI